MSVTTSAEPPLPNRHLIVVNAEQKRDNCIKEWTYWVEEHRKPTKKQLDRNALNTWFINNFEKLKLFDGILYRVINTNGELVRHLVLAETCFTTVMTSLHDDMAHQGRDKTLSLVKDRCVWYRDVEVWITNCNRGIRRKKQTNEKAALINIESSQPLELVCMDYLSLEESKGGYENILVITDHFTRYAIAIPTRNHTAKITAEAFFNNFVVHYGLPKESIPTKGPTLNRRSSKSYVTSPEWINREQHLTIIWGTA